jgi:hypothetical protein
MVHSHVPTVLGMVLTQYEIVHQVGIVHVYYYHKIYRHKTPIRFYSQFAKIQSP